MGVIQQVATCRCVTLATPSIVGRAPNCLVRIDRPEVSGAHASIKWAGGAWSIRDLNSRNGTFVDGKPMPSGHFHPLEVGTRLDFGRPDETWQIIDAGAPCAGFVPVDHSAESVLEDDGSIVFPGSDPLVTAFRVASDTWLVELDDQLQELQDGREISVAGVRWRFSNPAPSLESTLAASSEVGLANMIFVFDVSADEEHIRLKMRTPAGIVYDLGIRASYYLLLLLARARLADENGPNDAEAGWIAVEDLATMLGTDPAHVNVHVYRIRKVLKETGVVDALNILERRKGSGNLRIGCSNLQISPG